MIRYSKGYPIKAELLAVKPGGAGTVTVNEWEIAQNILPGQKIELSGAGGVPLAETLPMGTTFQLRVSENAGYFTDNAFSGLTDPLLTVEELPELAFDSFAVKTLNILENGDTQVQLDFSVSNRGTTAANGTYVQLAYQDGEESYSPLDLTGAKFNISNQQPLGRAMDLSLKNGVLRLQSTQENGDGDNISPNNGRTVSGVFTIPRDAYYKGDTGNSFNLRAEVFDADAAITGMDAGYYTATHKEYVSANNATNVALEQSTIFQLPNQIAMALGNTMQLPARIRTSSQTPAITVTEVPQGEDWVPNLGILYYNEAAQRIVIVPAQEGSGIIRVADAATNSYFDIAYKVDGVGVGINIYNDNAMFTFYGADGTPYTAEQAVPSWQFKESLQYGNDNTAPYRNDLSIANEVGSYFTFDTQAEKISLYFTGTVEISSDLPGFAPKQITSLTGAVPVEVSFGDNSDLRTHTVKVKAVMADAKFDRHVENFGAAAIPLPAKDKEAPQMYWSRSFPDTASILVGAPAVELVCYLLDNGTIQSVTVNGEVPKNLTKTTDGFWQFPLSISKNGEFSILATDTANNRTGYVLNVDWFAKVVSSGASAAAPNLSNVAFVDGKGTAITAPVGNGNKVRLTYTTDPLLRAEKAQYFNLQTVRFNDLTAEQNGDYLVNNNGVYRVLVVDENDKWRAEIRHMGWLDAEKPTVTLAQTTENGKQFLSYSVTKPKNSAAALSTVTINGVSVGTVSGYQSI